MKTIFNARWNTLDRNLVLASQSPRRREILSMMGFTFTIQKPLIENEEEFLAKGEIEESLQRLACAKADSVAVDNRESLVLGADTVVVSGALILGKPSDAGQAMTMLLQLSGKTHFVYTAVTLVCKERRFVCQALQKTSVTFRELSGWEIESYIAGDEWHDKAGAYAIQGNALVFVDKIDGCYYNVVGLPVRATIDCFSSYISRKDQAACQRKR